MPQLQSAQMVFTLDTAAEIMTLHAFSAEPLDGGQVWAVYCIGIDVFDRPLAVH
jgi:hypothetical protein